MGHAEGSGQMPRQASVDIVDDRRGHTRGISVAERPERISASVSRRTEPLHWRLDSRHECHKALHAKIRTKQASVVHRTRADAHPRTDSEPAEGDRQLQAGALLGIVNDIPRHAVHGHFWQVYQQGRRRAVVRQDSRQALCRNRRAEESRQRGSPRISTTLRRCR